MGGRAAPRQLAMLDVGVDGAADDRARADDGDLDDEIFQAAGLGARQGLDLGPALDLEGADRVARRRSCRRPSGRRSRCG